MGMRGAVSSSSTANLFRRAYRDILRHKRGLVAGTYAARGRLQPVAALRGSAALRACNAYLLPLLL